MLDRPVNVVRLLHTSDLHIGDRDGSVGGIDIVVRAAAELDVDVVLIAGDLFDNSRVSDDTASRAVDTLGRMGRPVVVIPGNHDCIDERSIYRRVDLRAAGAHVFFAGNSSGEEFVFEELSLAVWARGIESHDPSHRPLAGYEPADRRFWRVVLTHGHYVARGESSERSSQITQEEIGRLQCDYVALGHWHRFADVSEGEVKAFYSGSPCEPGRDPASINLVTLDPSTGPKVERWWVGDLSVELGDPAGLRVT